MLGSSIARDGGKLTRYWKMKAMEQGILTYQESR